MTWGTPTDLFLQIHVTISLVALASGLVVVYGLLTGQAPGGMTALFLVVLILTSVTGFPLPPFGFDPPRVVGVISLALLAIAVVTLYVFRLAGAWRWIYIVCVVAALYFDAFVAVVQSFQKVAFLQALAPTQSEPPFVVAQVVMLALFVVLGVVAFRNFHPAPPRPHEVCAGPQPPRRISSSGELPSDRLGGFGAASPASFLATSGGKSLILGCRWPKRRQPGVRPSPCRALRAGAGSGNGCCCAKMGAGAAVTTAATATTNAPEERAVRLAGPEGLRVAEPMRRNGVG